VDVMTQYLDLVAFPFLKSKGKDTGELAANPAIWPGF
jgi:hypothetical protein